MGGGGQSLPFSIDFDRRPYNHASVYSVTAAAVVESRLHEPCSVYYFASFYVRQYVSCSFVLPRIRSWRRRVGSYIINIKNLTF